MTRTLFAQMRAAAMIAAVAAYAAGCSRPMFDCVLAVRDEAGTPVEGVAARWPGGEVRTGNDGKAPLQRLEHPVMLLLAKQGYLEEPVAIGWDDANADVPVTLLSDHDGARLVLHFGGDTMFGRRYENPAQGGGDGKAGGGIIVPGDGGASAAALVAELSRPFGSADASLFNLETVVGRFADEQAYPGKLWIIRSDPDALAGCAALGADAVLLSNNHLRDFLEAGIAETIAQLDARGLEHAGAGTNAEQAELPLILERKGWRIGVLAYTSVDGDYINDNYPRDEETPPADLAPEDAWQWEAREWGWTGGVLIPIAARRIGSAWQSIRENEPLLAPEDQAALWESASAVYPELMDYVARRGHGGAAGWTQAGATAAIEALRPQVDLLVVNVHSGYQYAVAPNSQLRSAAYAAIDAGADLVVGNHPHVLQGAEFYKGKLIAWSLANLVFDQDFLVTFPSVFLRTVWENGALLEARFVPLVLEAYRPLPIADAAARRTLRAMWEQGLWQATDERGSDLAVRTVLPTEEPPDVAPAGFRLEHHSAVLTEGLPPESELPITLPPVEIRPLNVSGLVWAQPEEGALEGVTLGRSLFGWGGVEDVDTDDTAGTDATHWLMDSEFKRVSQVKPWHGNNSLQLYRTTTNQADLVVRPVARIPLREHRFWQNETTPADGMPAYSIHFAVRIDGEAGLGSVRLDCYYFDDTDPTVAPDSGVIRSIEYPIEADADGEWHEIWLDIPPAHLAPDAQARPVVSVMIYLKMIAAARRDTIMYFDDTDLVEWRAVNEMPAMWGTWDWVRSSREDAATLTFRTLDW